jgi:hypothetical protein
LSWHTVLFANSHVSSHRTIAPGGAAGEGSGKVSGEGSGEGSGEDGALVFGAGVVATTLGVARVASRAIRIDWPGFIVVRGLVARSFGMLLICARAMAVSGARSGRRQKVGLDGSGVGVRVFCGCARAAAAYCG